MPENRSWLPGIFSAADGIMSLFERLVAPFPYEKLAHLQSSTRFGGMENASAIFYDGRLFPQQKVTESVIAHETAHQWFGDAVTEREWGHLWLSEGFADYFERCGRGTRTASPPTVPCSRSFARRSSPIPWSRSGR
jgi:aminopeptidase N